MQPLFYAYATERGCPRNRVNATQPLDEVEVFVARHHVQPVLQGQSADPHVVLRDGTASSPQAFPDGRVSLCGRQADLEDDGFPDQVVEQRQEGASKPGAREPVTVLPDDDGG
jgi:hypothetical protein